MVQGGREAQKVSGSFLCPSAGYCDPSKGGVCLLLEGSSAAVPWGKRHSPQIINSSFFSPSDPPFQGRKSPGIVLPRNHPQQPGQVGVQLQPPAHRAISAVKPREHVEPVGHCCSLWEWPGTEGRCCGAAQAVPAPALGFWGFWGPWRKLSHIGSSAGASSV